MLTSNRMLFGCLFCLKTANVHYVPVHFPTFCIFFLIQSGQFSEDMIPTVGFNMRKVTKGNVTIKVRRRNKGSRWKLWIKSVSLWTSGDLELCVHWLSSCMYCFLLQFRYYCCTNYDCAMTIKIYLTASDMGHRRTASLQKHVGALL